MLARDRPAELYGDVEDLLHRLLPVHPGLLRLGIEEHLGVQVAIGRMSVGADDDVVLLGDLSEGHHGVGDLGDGDRHIIGQGDGA